MIQLQHDSASGFLIGDRIKVDAEGKAREIDLLRMIRGDTLDTAEAVDEIRSLLEGGLFAAPALNNVPPPVLPGGAGKGGESPSVAVSVAVAGGTNVQARDYSRTTARLEGVRPVIPGADTVARQSGASQTSEAVPSAGADIQPLASQTPVAQGEPGPAQPAPVMPSQTVVVPESDNGLGRQAAEAPPAQVVTPTGAPQGIDASRTEGRQGAERVRGKNGRFAPARDGANGDDGESPDEKRQTKALESASEALGKAADLAEVADNIDPTLQAGKELAGIVAPVFGVLKPLGGLFRKNEDPEEKAHKLAVPWYKRIIRAVTDGDKKRAFPLTLLLGALGLLLAPLKMLGKLSLLSKLLALLGGAGGLGGRLRRNPEGGRGRAGGSPAGRSPDGPGAPDRRGGPDSRPGGARGGPLGKMGGLLRRIPVLGTLIGGGMAAATLAGIGSDPDQSPEEARREKFGAVGGSAGAVVGALVGAVGGPLGMVVGGLVGDYIGGLVGEWAADVDWSAVGASIKGMWSGAVAGVMALWSGAVGLWSAGAELVGQLWAGAVDMFRGLWSGAVDLVIGQVQAVVQGVQLAIEGATSWATEKVTAVRETATEFVDGAKAKGAALLDGASRGLNWISGGLLGSDGAPAEPAQKAAADHIAEPNKMVPPEPAGKAQEGPAPAPAPVKPARRGPASQEAVTAAIMELAAERKAAAALAGAPVVPVASGQVVTASSDALAPANAVAPVAAAAAPAVRSALPAMPKVGGAPKIASTAIPAPQSVPQRIATTEKHSETTTILVPLTQNLADRQLAQVVTGGLGMMTS